MRKAASKPSSSEIHAAPREQNLNTHVRPEACVLEHERSEERFSKERIRRDAQDSLGFPSSVGYRAIGIVGKPNDFVALCRIRRSHVSELHLPRRPLQELDPKRAFEFADTTAERLFGTARSRAAAVKLRASAT